MTKLSVPQQKLLERIRRCDGYGYYLLTKAERRTAFFLVRNGLVTIKDDVARAAK